jgi:predicted nucleic acid-binding protein
VDARDAEPAVRIEEIIADEVALIVPSFVITVVAYLVSRRIGSDAEMRFLGDLAAGNLIAEPVAPADWMRIAELVDRYRDLPLGTVDASVIAAAERLQITEIATLDRRHFNVVRSQPGPLTLLR